jgi:hypothetical protein
MFQTLATVSNCPKASHPSNGVLHNKDMERSFVQGHGAGKVGSTGNAKEVSAASSSTLLALIGVA